MADVPVARERRGTVQHSKQGKQSLTIRRFYKNNFLKEGQKNNKGTKGGMADETALQVLGVFLTAAYMVVKGKSFMKAIRLWKDAAQKVLQSTRLITSS